MSGDIKVSDSFIFRNQDEGDRSDPLREAVKSYKEAMRSAKQDLNVMFLLKTLNVVNGLSPLKVARNPIDKEGRWRSGVEMRSVRGFEIDAEGRLMVRTSGDKIDFPADTALEKLDKIDDQLQKDGPVMLSLGDGKEVQITDAFSHAFIGDAYAGLPFELVLAYFDKDADEEKGPVDGPAEGPVDEVD